MRSSLPGSLTRICFAAADFFNTSLFPFAARDRAFVSRIKRLRSPLSGRMPFPHRPDGVTFVPDRNLSRIWADKAAAPNASIKPIFGKLGDA